MATPLTVDTDLVPKAPEPAPNSKKVGHSGATPALAKILFNKRVHFEEEASGRETHDNQYMFFIFSIVITMVSSAVMATLSRAWGMPPMLSRVLLGRTLNCGARCYKRALNSLGLLYHKDIPLQLANDEGQECACPSLNMVPEELLF